MKKPVEYSTVLITTVNSRMFAFVGGKQSFRRRRSRKMSEDIIVMSRKTKDESLLTHLVFLDIAQGWSPCRSLVGVAQLVRA